MINPRIALSVASIGAAAVLGVGATFAVFTDSGTSTNNTFAAGTLDIKLSDNDQTALDSIDTTFNSSTMAPGANPVTQTIQLRNGGTVAGNHVFLKAANVVTDNGTTEDSTPMDTKLEITAATYEGNNILASLPDTNANGIHDLNDLVVVGDGVQIGTLTDLGPDHALVLTVQLHSSADNSYQGDSTGTTFTATLSQN